MQAWIPAFAGMTNWSDSSFRRAASDILSSHRIQDILSINDDIPRCHSSESWNDSGGRPRGE